MPFTAPSPFRSVFIRRPSSLSVNHVPVNYRQQCGFVFSVLTLNFVLPVICFIILPFFTNVCVYVCMSVCVCVLVFSIISKVFCYVENVIESDDSCAGGAVVACSSSLSPKWLGGWRREGWTVISLMGQKTAMVSLDKI